MSEANDGVDRWHDEPAGLEPLDPARVELARLEGELMATRELLVAARGAAQEAAADAARAAAERDDLRAKLEAARREVAAAREEAGRDGGGSEPAVERRLEVIQEWVKAVFFEVCAHTAFASPKEERQGLERAGRQLEATAQQIAGKLDRRRRDREAAAEAARQRQAWEA
jgi:hypothetical protein